MDKYFEDQIHDLFFNREKTEGTPMKKISSPSEMEVEAKDSIADPLNIAIAIVESGLRSSFTVGNKSATFNTCLFDSSVVINEIVKLYSAKGWQITLKYGERPGDGNYLLIERSYSKRSDNWIPDDAIDSKRNSGNKGLL